MRQVTIYIIALGFLILLIVQRTESELSPRVVSGKEEKQSAAVGQSQRKTIDDLFAEVAKRVPEFGGMFLSDDQQRLQVYLLDLTKKAEAEAAIVAVFSPYRHDLSQKAQRGIQVLQGQYGFLQLKEWQDRMRGAVRRIQRVTFTDIDEMKNRLKIGVESVAMTGLVENELVKLGIPREAVIIEERKPFRFAATHKTLTSKVRPLVGGLQIHGIGAREDFTCTLGFIAKNRRTNGFVTASHCTSTMDGVGKYGTYFFQPTSESDSNAVGFEQFDAPLSDFIIPEKYSNSKWSDSAFIEFERGVSASRGFIARTPLDGKQIYHRMYRISAEAPFPVGREVLSKVGRITGRTEGPVVQTCINTSIKEKTDTGETIDVTFICQDVLDIVAKKGDSGSPVFMITNRPARYDVTLYGVLSGGTEGYIAFSSMSNIELDLGALTTCAPSVPVTPSSKCK